MLELRLLELILIKKGLTLMMKIVKFKIFIYESGVKLSLKTLELSGRIILYITEGFVLVKCKAFPEYLKKQL